MEHASKHAYAAEAESSSLLEGQQPFATVFGCADSRVPVELIFDQSFGDLFVIRNAGYIVGETVLGSMEFAVSRIGCPLIVVLGHTGCGAVTAALQAVRTGTYPSGHLVSIVRAIEPAVRRTASGNVDDVTRAHAVDTARQILAASPPIARSVREGSLGIAAAEYNLGTRRVEVLEMIAE